MEGSFGDDDEVWAGDAEVMFEVGEEGDGSKGLAETLKTVSYNERMVLANIIKTLRPMSLISLWMTAKEVRHAESGKGIIQLTAR